MQRRSYPGLRAVPRLRARGRRGRLLDDSRLLRRNRWRRRRGGVRLACAEAVKWGASESSAWACARASEVSAFPLGPLDTQRPDLPSCKAAAHGARGLCLGPGLGRAHGARAARGGALRPRRREGFPDFQVRHRRRPPRLDAGPPLTPRRLDRLLRPPEGPGLRGALRQLAPPFEQVPCPPNRLSFFMRADDLTGCRDSVP